jgi:hypothetical protein
VRRGRGTPQQRHQCQQRGHPYGKGAFAEQADLRSFFQKREGAKRTIFRLPFSPHAARTKRPGSASGYGASSTVTRPVTRPSR